MVSKSAILIVEDDENLRIALRDNLEEEGYAVTEATDAGSAALALRREVFDLVILDIMLPDGDGRALCRNLRADGGRPLVLMLTARALEEDLVAGLDAGADDYLVKPYRLRELLARVRALLRRGASPDRAGEFLRCGDYRVDLGAREVIARDGTPVQLTRTEFDLLCYLLRNRGRAVQREEILGEVWGKGVVVDDHTVDNFVSRLKKKLHRTARPGFSIQTIRGVGYRMDLEP